MISPVRVSAACWSPGASARAGSEGAANTNGHTAVVTNVSVTNGTGTVTIMQQNATSNGWGSIQVAGNVLRSGVTGWLHAPATSSGHALAFFDATGDGLSMCQSVSSGFDGCWQTGWSYAPDSNPSAVVVP